jgi:hypothetical protein
MAAIKVLYRFNGQAGYKEDAGRLKRINVVFGMIDEPRLWMGWYKFISDAKAKSKRELAKHHPAPQERFGHRTAGGRDIPQTFYKNIDLDGLAIHPKGTHATLTLDLSETKRFVECRISHLKTKAKEVVTFPFGLECDSDPSWAGPINGTVKFLEIARYDVNQFPRGPEGFFAFGGCIP